MDLCLIHQGYVIEIFSTVCKVGLNVWRRREKRGWSRRCCDITIKASTSSGRQDMQKGFSLIQRGCKDPSMQKHDVLHDY